MSYSHARARWFHPQPKLKPPLDKAGNSKSYFTDINMLTIEIIRQTYMCTPLYNRRQLTVNKMLLEKRKFKEETVGDYKLRYFDIYF